VLTYNDVILDCYQLAKHYSRNPVEFLAMTMTEIMRHMYWTIKLAEKLHPEDDDG